MPPRKKRSAPAPIADLVPSAPSVPSPRRLRPSVRSASLPSIAAVQLALACLGCGRERPRASETERSLVTITADPQAKAAPSSAPPPADSAAPSSVSPASSVSSARAAMHAPPDLRPRTRLAATPLPPAALPPPAPPPPAWSPPAVMGTVGPPVSVPASPPAPTPPTPGAAAP